MLVGLPGAHPSVMDLPSVARVTKLPLDKLEAMAKDTPVFAPGLDNMVQTGAVQAVLDPGRPLGPQIEAVIDGMPAGDTRDALGRERAGRPVAQEIAAQVVRDAGPCLTAADPSAPRPPRRGASRLGRRRSRRGRTSRAHRTSRLGPDGACR